MASHATGSSLESSETPDSLRTRNSPLRAGYRQSPPRSLSIDPLAANRPTAPPKPPLYASPRPASYSSSSLSNEYQYQPPATPSSSTGSFDTPSFSFSFTPPKPDVAPSPSFYGPPSAAHSSHSAYSNYSSTGDSSPTGSPRYSRRPSLSPLEVDDYTYPASSSRRSSNASSTASFALSLKEGLQNRARRFSHTASLRSSRKGDESDRDDGWGSTFEDDWEGCSTGGGSRRGSFGPLSGAMSLGSRRSSSGWLQELGRKTSMPTLRGSRRSSDHLSQSLLSPAAPPPNSAYNPALPRKNSGLRLVPSLDSRSFPTRTRRSSHTQYIPIIGGLPQNVRECIILLVLLLTVLWAFSLLPPAFNSISTTSKRPVKPVAHHPITEKHLAEPRHRPDTFPLLAHEMQHHKPSYKLLPSSAFQTPKSVATAAPKVDTPRPFFWDSPREELGSLINYITSSPSHTLSTYIPPNLPLDPQLVLDFSPFSPDAHSLIKVMVDDLFDGNNDAIGEGGKMIIIGSARDPATELIVGLLDSLEVFPPPYLINLDTRSDAAILGPLFKRMLSHSGKLPSLIVSGEVVGDYMAISRLQQSTGGSNFYDLLSNAGVDFVDPSLGTTRDPSDEPSSSKRDQETSEDDNHDSFGLIPGEDEEDALGEESASRLLRLGISKGFEEDDDDW